MLADSIWDGYIDPPPPATHDDNEDDDSEAIDSRNILGEMRLSVQTSKFIPCTSLTINDMIV